MKEPCSKTQKFLTAGSSSQFEWVLGLYDRVLRLKAESKSKKPKELIQLDKWYQNDLPETVRTRGEQVGSLFSFKVSCQVLTEDLSQV